MPATTSSGSAPTASSWPPPPTTPPTAWPSRWHPTPRPMSRATACNTPAPRRPAGGTAIDLSASGGRHTLGREGIEVSGAASAGQHLLEIDLTAGATGTGHLLQGAGGARALVGSVAADNHSTASAIGSARAGPGGPGGPPRPRPPH